MTNFKKNNLIKVSIAVLISIIFTSTFPALAEEISVEEADNISTTNEVESFANPIELIPTTDPIISAPADPIMLPSGDLIPPVDEKNLMSDELMENENTEVVSGASESTDPDSAEESTNSGVDPNTSIENIEVEIPVQGTEAESIPTTIIRKIAVDRLDILASWQMSSEKTDGSYRGTDASKLLGTQILPSGKFETDTSVVTCALIADRPENIRTAIAKISYPQNVSVHKNNEETACGQEKSRRSLQELSKSDSEQLVCGRIRNENNNLINWKSNASDGYSYSFQQVCGDDGVIASDNAKVYCVENDFAYDDPAGDYSVEIIAMNNIGQTDSDKDDLRYLELTMFENDFSDLQYGNVGKGEWQTLAGDSDWTTPGAPTVRNVGNTPLKLKIQQNDFGFGRSNDSWNIAYKASIGDSAEDTYYLPGQNIYIDNPLNVGDTANLDFSVFVNEFPTNTDQTKWSGELTILAEKLDFEACE